MRVVVAIPGASIPLQYMVIYIFKIYSKNI